MVSKTVTVAVQVEVFKQESLANKVTVFAPTFPQSKLVLLKLRVLAVLPLSISGIVKAVSYTHLDVYKRQTWLPIPAQRLLLEQSKDLMDLQIDNFQE